MFYNCDNKKTSDFHGALSFKYLALGINFLQMKKIRKLLLGIFGLVCILLITALFVKKEFVIEREIVINKPAVEVYDYIKYLKNQDKYSKWFMMDPKMKRMFKGNDGAIGFISSWKSEKSNVGSGEQEITNLIPAKRIETKIRFKTPFESEANSYMATDSSTNNQTIVKWGFKSSMPYPFNLLGLIMNMENEVGADLETGLNNLKKLLEKE